MSTIFNKVVIVLYSGVVSLAGGQDVADVQNFLHITEARIIDTLRQNATELGKNGEHLIKGLRDYQNPKNDVTWKIVDTAGFEQTTFAPSCPFYYVYTTENMLIGQRQTLTELLKQDAASPSLHNSTNKLLSEMARSIGEQIIRLDCGDFREYWCAGNFQRIQKKSTHHLYDAEGRVNPVALYGLYAEYIMRQKHLNNAGWHDFLEKLAEQNTEFEKLAKTAKQHYPEEGKVLRKMLGHEATWSACWIMAKKALLTYCGNEKDAKEEGREIVEQINKCIQNLMNAKLPEAQKNYIHQKYPMDKLASGLDLPPDKLAQLEESASELHIITPANADEVRKQEIEKKRLKQMSGVCGMTADYIRLLPKESAWELESDFRGNLTKYDDEMRKLVFDIYYELLHIFIDKQDAINELLSKVTDKVTADKYAPHILQKQREAGVAAMHFEQLRMKEETGTGAGFGDYFISIQLFHPIHKQKKKEEKEFFKHAIRSVATYQQHLERLNADNKRNPYGSIALDYALHDPHEVGARHPYKEYKKYAGYASSTPFRTAQLLRAEIILLGGAHRLLR